jgi:hypothetical protein
MQNRSSAVSGLRDAALLHCEGHVTQGRAGRRSRTEQSPWQWR